MIRKVTAIVACLIGVTSPAWATGPLVDNSTNANAGAYAAGGDGGQGGKGGTVYNTNVVAPSQRTDVDVKNVDVNDLSNRNNQGQKQGQGQGQAQKQQQGQKQGQGQKQSINDSANNTNVIEGDVEARQAPAIFAPNLAASPEACMGSISGGGSAAFQGVGFGLTIGSTWKNADCERRAFAREIRSMPGLTEAQKGAVILALLAQNSDVEQAFVNAKVPIPGKTGVAAAAAPTVQQGGVKQEKRDAAITIEPEYLFAEPVLGAPVVQSN